MSQLDSILQRVGAFGKWQRVQFAFLAPSAIFITWQHLLYIFISYLPSNNYKCGLNQSQFANCYNEKCNESQKVFKTTVVDEWPSLCTNPMLKASLQCTYFLGFSLGTFVFYQACRKYGRKRLALLCVILLTVCGTVASYSYFYWVLVGFRFFTGCFIAGLQLAVIFLSFEMTGSAYHMWILCMWSVTHALGYMLLSAVAASFSRWNAIYLVASVPVLVLMFYSCLIPESAKWLLTKGRKADTERILRKIALANGHILKHESVTLNAKEITSVRRYTRKHITNDKSMLAWSIVLLFEWMFHEFGYYILVLVLPRLSVKYVFASHTLAGLGEIIAVITVLVCIKFMKRKVIMVIGCAICIFGCVVAASVQMHSFSTITVAMALFAKFGLGVSYSTVQVVTFEMYPDELRLLLYINFIGISKLGAAFAPFIEITIEVLEYLPFVVVSSIVFISLLCCFLLPETFGKNIDDPLGTKTDDEGDEMQEFHVKQREIPTCHKLSKVPEEPEDISLQQSINDEDGEYGKNLQLLINDDNVIKV